MKKDFNIEIPHGRSLADLAPGERALVAEVLVDGPLGRRLMDLGLLPQTPVQALRRSPLGDPTVYVLRGYQLCLRKADAARVRIHSDADSGEKRA
jgi:ferrous iron transport protein A